MGIKQFLKGIIYKQYASSETYVDYLRSKGAIIGEGTHFYTPEKYPVDETSIPFLEIGKNCRITDNAMLLLHDYSYAVLRPVYHAMLLKSGAIKIGNNVFIGTRSIILMNTTIGDNVIIGAGSVVSGKFGSNIVIAGNPAKVICSLDDYYQKCHNNFDKNAKLFYVMKSRYLKRPLSENEMSWYIVLWKASDIEQRRNILSKMRVDGDDKQELIADILNWQPIYDSYADFLGSFEHDY